MILTVLCLTPNMHISLLNTVHSRICKQWWSPVTNGIQWNEGMLENTLINQLLLGILTAAVVMLKILIESACNRINTEVSHSYCRIKKSSRIKTLLRASNRTSVLRSSKASKRVRRATTARSWIKDKVKVIKQTISQNRLLQKIFVENHQILKHIYFQSQQIPVQVRNFLLKKKDAPSLNVSILLRQRSNVKKKVQVPTCLLLTDNKR